MASTDSGKRLIAKLNNDNYYAWSYRMEMCFRKLGVWSLVDENFVFDEETAAVAAAVNMVAVAEGDEDFSW